MPTRARPPEAPPAKAALSPRIADALDRLYAAPLGDFLRVRRELARELRGEGERAAAKRVEEAHKPTRTAWAVNEVARHAPERVRALLDARARAAEAQETGEAVAEALAAYRAALAEAVHAAEEVLRASGAKTTAAQRRRIAESFEAAGADASFVRARLVGGRLERDAAREDPAASLVAAGARAKVARPEKKGRARAAEARAREEARAKEEARAARQRAEEEERAAKAREELLALERAAKEAGDAADRARREAEEARRRLEAARRGISAKGRRGRRGGA